MGEMKGFAAFVFPVVFVVLARGEIAWEYKDVHVGEDLACQVRECLIPAGMVEVAKLEACKASAPTSCSFKVSAEGKGTITTSLENHMIALDSIFLTPLGPVTDAFPASVSGSLQVTTASEPSGVCVLLAQVERQLVHRVPDARAIVILLEVVYPFYHEGSVLNFELETATQQWAQCGDQFASATVAVTGVVTFEGSLALPTTAKPESSHGLFLSIIFVFGLFRLL
eukprot:Gregarina_sp_Pseudo_9__1994@NODE_2382_length_1015_cov_9_868852_g2194_i0_p1_GENE_NODE_2382_length_1015_cov_9_868852_g2194_i0NODE_2382_length_1015_cov_9_868852_g2194_i0_p1_ORF_typecomplete_len226_score34_64PAC2/PF09754_9/0_014_NODE_2382_length_1015_cov_9_868852_g2194_i03680